MRRQEALIVHADGSTERVIVGPDLRNGQRVQLLIPGNTFHTARLIGRRQWFLGASTEWLQCLDTKSERVRTRSPSTPTPAPEPPIGGNIDAMMDCGHLPSAVQLRRAGLRSVSQ